MTIEPCEACPFAGCACQWQNPKAARDALVAAKHVEEDA